MQQGALKYYASAVNTRSALAEHGGLLVGWYHLLCLYCAEQVNGGVIQNCKSWTAKQWMIRVGLDDCPKDVSGLFHWNEDDLIVEGYNVEAEEKALNRRHGGKKAAEARWGKREDVNNAPSITNCNPMSNAKRITDSNAECSTPSNAKERKGKERKGEERREKEASPVGSLVTTAPSRSSLPSSPEEVEAYLKNEVGRGCLLLPPREIPECAQQYWADRDGLGWVDRSGVPISNWKSNAWGYARRWVRNLETTNQPLGGEKDPFDPKLRKNINP